MFQSGKKLHVLEKELVRVEKFVEEKSPTLDVFEFFNRYRYRLQVHTRTSISFKCRTFKRFLLNFNRSDKFYSYTSEYLYLLDDE